MVERPAQRAGPQRFLLILTFSFLTLGEASQVIHELSLCKVKSLFDSGKSQKWDQHASILSAELLMMASFTIQIFAIRMRFWGELKTRLSAHWRVCKLRDGWGEVGASWEVWRYMTKPQRIVGYFCSLHFLSLLTRKGSMLCVGLFKSTTAELYYVSF